RRASRRTTTRGRWRSCGGGSCSWSCRGIRTDRKSTRLNSSHRTISYAVFCLKKKKKKHIIHNLPDLYNIFFLHLTSIKRVRISRYKNSTRQFPTYNVYQPHKPHVSQLMMSRSLLSAC